MIYTTAVIVASFSSGYSWNTYKALTRGSCHDLKSDDIKNEFGRAKDEMWKKVNSFDIREILQKNISQTKFMNWLYYNVKNEEHKQYKNAWFNLEKILNMPYPPIRTNK